ncbi:Uncharacterised protein [Budvicia aquatica]|uniref:DUF4422 domain-containing protein n=1 Tax=Budvicia aquatica TaxID=82979 RepID=A0A484ZZJ7_9GAMM|nr:Uncharacterised protein [Budvicia aquatica]
MFDFSELLNGVDIIVPEKNRFFGMTLSEQYAKYHNKADLDITRSVIEDMYPEYIFYFDSVMNESISSFCNMFVSKKKYY